MKGYKKAIKEQMEMLAKDPKTIFLGQQVASETFYNTLTDIPIDRRLEMPVAEELQMGISIGLSLEGYLPISIYQRMDFLPRACDQLVNHLDLMEKLSNGLYKPKVIIRTTVGSNDPFDVGLQHNKDLSSGFARLFNNINIYRLRNVDEVYDTYRIAKELNKSTLIIEYQDLYEE